MRRLRKLWRLIFRPREPLTGLAARKTAERRDSFGRLCVRPDPLNNPGFVAYARVFGIHAARSAFSLHEEDPYL